MKDRIKRLANLFEIDEDILSKAMKEEKDLYTVISELTGLSRTTIKRWAHGVMYSTTLPINMKGVKNV